MANIIAGAVARLKDQVQQWLSVSFVATLGATFKQADLVSRVAAEATRRQPEFKKRRKR